MKAYLKIFLSFILGSVVIGCAGINTFDEVALPGDTIAVPIGWKKNINQDTVKVTITDSSLAGTTYLPGDAEIRAVVNMYIDPLASIVVSRQMGIDQTNFAQTYADTTSVLFTGNDKDWWQTVVFVDLPAVMSTGTATVLVNDDGDNDGLAITESVTSNVNILSGAGSRHRFDAEILGPMTPDQMASLSRVDHFTVNFSTTTVVPSAVQIDLVHNPDVDNGGVGRAYVVNPIGYIKNASWKDDGTNMKVILMPVRDGEIITMEDFKFYVAGGVTGLAVGAVQAYDINGSPVAGVSASVN